MAEWGDDSDLDQIDKLNLLYAYIRRQQFLAKLQASEVAKLFSGNPSEEKKPRPVSTAEMMRRVNAR